MAAAAAQGTYLASPITTLAHMPQIGALAAAPNGITTAAITPTTATLANGQYILFLILLGLVNKSRSEGVMSLYMNLFRFYIY